MSVSEQDQGAPIVPGSPLARVLDDYAVPGLSAGFADRVLAAAEVRPAPLPEVRRTRGERGWRLGRGIAIGIASFGALATAAAATGLLQQFDIPVPTAEKVWASLTGKPPARAAAPAPVIAAAPDAASEPASLARVEIVGPVDTPEELSEAFRRIDEVREGRYAARRETIAQRIDKAIEQRRSAGLPVPTHEEEAAFRQRVDEAQARRQQLADERIAARRAEMERKVANGEALTRKDIVQPLREDARALERLRQLRRMSPEQRREALRQLPPEERRALMDEYRAQRIGAAAPTPAVPAENAPAE
ncbi:hypothetical protein FHS52_002398 [Erythromicrobium ramosum]|uniref:Uncharacterized protein n=1 Tax=Erythrobacter ramosus TaxID=35811 RepID=A0A6I4UHY8_9SPHN|nr:hypothetical protein [Erythrobacter ramosus]MBB3776429.1 hypothetical protein [Erythrobacter ramosus]MXP38492.1 hypothetical protein [Erythrobacter ramosus]